MSSSAASTTASSTSHLTNSALPLTALRDYYRTELSTLLSLSANVGGKDAKERKALVLDKTLSGPLGLIAEASLLHSQGIEQNQIHHLKEELYTTANHVMYLVRPSLSNMRLIASHILSHRNSSTSTSSSTSKQRAYSVFFLPRKSMLCEKELEQLGVLGDITHMCDYHLELIPFDEDVLSMELTAGFRDTTLDGDPTILLDLARSLMKIQSICGLIPTIKGKGVNAVKVYNLLQRLRREGGFNVDGGSGPGASSSRNSALSSTIDSLILIDRTSDLVTPLMSQLTYEGLLDDVFTIRNSCIDVDADLVGAGNEKDPKKPGAAAATPSSSSSSNSGLPPTLKKLLLNSSDSLFKETRDLNFRVLGPLLHKRAEYIKETYSERHTAQTVNEMHNFMQKFKTAHAEHNFLQTHINLAERIAQMYKSKIFDRRIEVERFCVEGIESDQVEEYIEGIIARNENILSVLRMMCIYSLTSGGLKQKRYDFFRREFIQTYGFQYIFTLNNLEKLGMFTTHVAAGIPEKEGGKAAISISKQLQLAAGLGRSWTLLKKGFSLVKTSVQAVDNKGQPIGSNPAAADQSTVNDIAYVFNGYAPLSVRLIEVASKPGWRRYDELLSFIPGKSFEYKQESSGVTPNPVNLLEGKGPTATAEEIRKELALTTKEATPAAAAATKKPVTLVCFIGGVTMSEISALRFLSDREEHGRDYVICTTKLVNGTSFIEPIIEIVDNQLNGGPQAQAQAQAQAATTMAQQQPPMVGRPSAAGAATGRR